MKNSFIAIRIAVTVLAAVPISLLAFAMAVGGTLAKLSPTYSEPSMAYNFIGGIYTLFTAILFLGAVWIRSRILLITATLFLTPVFLLCCILAFVASPLALCALFPVIWMAFFFVAWPQYKATEWTPSKAKEVWTPEEY